MNYREWLRTASEDDIAETLCEIQGRGGCGGCVGVNYTGSDGTCSGKPGEAVRKWLQAEKEPGFKPGDVVIHKEVGDAYVVVGIKLNEERLYVINESGDILYLPAKIFYASGQRSLAIDGITNALKRLNRGEEDTIS